MKDVDIFAACLKELLLENDTVTVPGLGCFMTRLMPASFSDKGRTINPPYRKLSFRSSQQGDAALFVDHLSSLLPEEQDAGQWLAAFTASFKAELDKVKNVELAGLGAMRSTEQNDYFFVASDDLDIYPEGLGLEAVTILSNLPEEAEETAQEPEPKPLSAREKPVKAVKPGTPEVGSGSRKPLQWWIIALIVLAAILLFLILSVAFKDHLPWGAAFDNFINHLLYSEEELRLLNS